MQLPLTVKRSATVHAPATQVWAVLTAPDLLARCMDGIEHIRPLTHGGGRRYETTGSLLGQPYHAVLVVDSQTPPALLTFHFEDWRIAGKSVRVAEANQYWFALNGAGMATEVELGAGFKPYSRKNELELRASLLLSKRQFDTTLTNLSELARTTEPAALSRPKNTPAPPPKPSEPKGPSKKLQVGYLAATLGSRARHPGVRGTSQLTAKVLERRLAKQAAAAPAPDDVRSALASTDAVLGAIRDHVHSQPPPHLAALHQAFGEKALRLSGDALRYALGASHIGYAVRQTEEELVAQLPALDEVSDLLSTEWRDASLSDVQVVNRVATNYGLRSQKYGWQLSVMTVPWNPPQQRQVWREVSLELLTNPGASFRRRPRGVSDDQTRQCWEHGFAVRCCEMSFPTIPGRRFTAFEARC